MMQKIEHMRGSARAKTLSFGVLHFSVAFAVAYLLTGDVLVGGLMALVEPAVNTVAFHFHELAWRRFEQPHGAVQARAVYPA